MLRTLLAASLLAVVVAPAVAAPAVPTISYFVKESRGMAWVKLENGKQEHVITAFPGFGQPTVAWSKDGRKALVWIQDDESHNWVWEVTLPDGKSRVMPLPKLGELLHMAYDPQGRPVALVAQNEHQEKGGLKPITKGGKSAFVFEGKAYPIEAGAEGEPELEHALRFEGGAWKRYETKVSSTGWDYGMRTDALDANKTLSPQSQTQRDLGEGPDTESVTDPRLVKKLSAIAPNEVSDGGEWGRFKTPGGPVYVWQEQGEFVHPTTCMVWGSSFTRVKGLEIPNPKPFTYNDKAPQQRFIAPMLKGNHLLVANPVGSFPRLYDTTSKALVWSSNQATDACFWPQ